MAAAAALSASPELPSAELELRPANTLPTTPWKTRKAVAPSSCVVLYSADAGLVLLSSAAGPPARVWVGCVSKRVGVTLRTALACCTFETVVVCQQSNGTHVHILVAQKVHPQCGRLSQCVRLLEGQGKHLPTNKLPDLGVQDAGVVIRAASVHLQCLYIGVGCVECLAAHRVVG